MMCLPVLAALAKAGAPRAAGASIGGVENTHGMSGGPAILGTGSPVHAVSDGGLISQDEARHLTDLLRADGTLDEAEASGALSGSGAQPRSAAMSCKCSVPPLSFDLVS